MILLGLAVSGSAHRPAPRAAGPSAAARSSARPGGCLGGEHLGDRVQVLVSGSPGDMAR